MIGDRFSTLLHRLVHRDRPLRRWTDSELTTERDYLNSFTGKAEAETLAFQIRAAEYLVQRYYPRDVTLMESHYDRWHKWAVQRMTAVSRGEPVAPRSPDPEFLAWMDAKLRLPGG